MKLSYTARARDDMELAFMWYEKQQKGLGVDFLNCLETAIISIIENPEMYRIHYHIFRGCIIRRFPFSIFYTIEGREIIVHSVFDNRQNPKNRPNL